MSYASERGQALVEMLIILPIFVVLFFIFSFMLFQGLQYADVLNQQRVETIYVSRHSRISNCVLNQKDTVFSQATSKQCVSSNTHAFRLGRLGLSSLITGWIPSFEQWRITTSDGQWKGLGSARFLGIFHRFNMAIILSDPLPKSLKKIHKRLEHHAMAWSVQANISQSLVKLHRLKVSGVDAGWRFNRQFSMDWIYAWKSLIQW
ncbi:MAG: pilus assembly protein [Alcaligenaceae bacterium]|nr:pilus assembly protein [Alcaligenaceae bacterium]